ncbi:MAG: DUF4198 domain-containing protein, partial [Candidatus Binatia bacterium]
PSTAHDYWFEPDGDGYLLYRGHRYSGHEGDKIVPYDPAIVKKTYCASPRGVVQSVVTSSEYPIRIAGPCAALVVDVDSGYWSQTLTGTKNQPKDELFGVLRSWHALESPKLLTAWTDDLSRPLSEGFEIVSETNPFQLRNGQKLRLRVMQAGKPRGGVTVAYDGDPRGVTGKDGRVNIRIRHDGTQRITASVEEPPADDKADKLVRSAALLFELAAGK